MGLRIATSVTWAGDCRYRIRIEAHIMSLHGSGKFDQAHSISSGKRFRVA
jgi:hypothetical protein